VVKAMQLMQDRVRVPVTAELRAEASIVRLLKEPSVVKEAQVVQVKVRVPVTKPLV